VYGSRQSFRESVKLLSQFEGVERNAKKEFKICRGLFGHRGEEVVQITKAFAGPDAGCAEANQLRRIGGRCHFRVLEMY
jgi:hypothetical protein